MKDHSIPIIVLTDISGNKTGEKVVNAQNVEN